MNNSKKGLKMSRNIHLSVNSIEYEILKAIGNLILMREEEDNNNKKIDINAHSVSCFTGRSYVTTKKYLKKLKDL